MVVKSTMTRQPGRMSRALLSSADAAFWQAFQLVHRVVSSRVERELEERVKLSGPELGVLSSLLGSDAGKLRQQRLADALGWEKSRLSHQLSRMAARGLVERRRDSGKSVTVQITRRGRSVFATAQEVQAAAVRTHLLTSVLPRERAVLERVYARLSRPSG